MSADLLGTAAPRTKLAHRPELLPINPEERLQAKITNRRVDLGASTLNAIALALIAGSLFFPIFEQDKLDQIFRSPLTYLWLAVALALHIFAHVAYAALEPED